MPRFATFNASLFRPEAGQLIRDLSEPNDSQAQPVAAIIQHIRPDILLLQEFDYDSAQIALTAFQNHYLAQPQQADLKPIFYPYTYSPPSNTGILSGLDLDGDGTLDSPYDAFGYGTFAGQYAFSLLSVYPIDFEKIRTFQHFLWKDLKDSKIPPHLSPEITAILRLSSKNHIDVPIHYENQIIHVLAAHPTPPLDSPHGINCLRNADEIQFFSNYLIPENSVDLYDDNGQYGGLPPETPFIVMGDLNADPFMGDSERRAIQTLLHHPAIDAATAYGKRVPRSQGGIYHAKQLNRYLHSNPAYHTAQFNKYPLRIDYVLPSLQFQIKQTGVFWATPMEYGYEWIHNNRSSDHRLVWIDADLPNK